ncbi:hypothetical protein DDN23_15395 [Vibrio cholerae]|nr:hypothetical protein [Vibrio cholerae]EGR3978432.1 hypothetical protein [Vibrio cholerae]OFI96780.1 hypothetical protein BFX21_02010 [Vibrio cholerae]
MKILILFAHGLHTFRDDMSIDTATYCKNYTERYLNRLKEKNLWPSWHPVMECMLKRHDEMADVYREIMRNPHFEAECLTKYDRELRGNSALMLTLEAFWNSRKEYGQEPVTEKRAHQKELTELHECIQDRALMLAEDMRRYKTLLAQGRYEHESYTTIVELMHSAADGNGHYWMYVKDELEKLDSEYDNKYWPKPEDLIQAVAEHYASVPLPVSVELPQSVMDGRRALIKDYVLALELELKTTDQIPSFRLSHSAMATLTNVVLELPADAMVTGETIRQIRNRYKS